MVRIDWDITPLAMHGFNKRRAFTMQFGMFLNYAFLKQNIDSLYIQNYHNALAHMNGLGILL